MPNVKETLLAARAKLAKPENWTQGSYTTGNNCFCLVGALVNWNADDMELDPALRLLAHMVKPDLEPHAWIVSGILTDWNDADDRTHAEVLALLDKALETTS